MKKRRILISLASIIGAVAITASIATPIILNSQTVKQNQFANKSLKSSQNIEELDFKNRCIFNALKEYIAKHNYNFSLANCLKNTIPLLPSNLLDFKTDEFINLLDKSSSYNNLKNENFREYILKKTGYSLNKNQICSYNLVTDDLNGTLKWDMWILLQNQWYCIGNITYSNLDNIYTFFQKTIANGVPFNVPPKWQWNVPNVNKFNYAWGQWAEIEYCLLQTVFDRLLKFKWFNNEVAQLPNAVRLGWIGKFNNLKNFDYAPLYIADFDTFDNNGYKINPYGTWLGNHGQREHLWSNTGYLRFEDHTKWTQIGAYQFKCEMQFYLPRINKWASVPNVYINWWNSYEDEQIEKDFQNAFTDISDLSSVATIFAK